MVVPAPLPTTSVMGQPPAYARWAGACERGDCAASQLLRRPQHALSPWYSRPCAALLCQWGCLHQWLHLQQRHEPVRQRFLQGEILAWRSVHAPSAHPLHRRHCLLKAAGAMVNACSLRMSLCKLPRPTRPSAVHEHATPIPTLGQKLCTATDTCGADCACPANKPLCDNGTCKVESMPLQRLHFVQELPAPL